MPESRQDSGPRVVRQLPSEATATHAIGASLTVRSQRHPGLVSIFARGELDLATAPKLIRTFHRFAHLSSNVRLDLSGVTFIDVAGLRALIAIHYECENAQRGLAIVLAQPIEQLLDIAKLTGALDPISAGAVEHAAEPEPKT